MTTPETIGQLIAYMESHFSRIDERFSNIDEHFAQMNNRMNERFAHVDERLLQLSEQLVGTNDRMNHRFAHVDELLETIAMATNAHTTDMSRLDENTIDHKARIERLERSVARLNMKLVN